MWSSLTVSLVLAGVGEWPLRSLAWLLLCLLLPFAAAFLAALLLLHRASWRRCLLTPFLLTSYSPHSWLARGSLQLALLLPFVLSVLLFLCLLLACLLVLPLLFGATLAFLLSLLCSLSLWCGYCHSRAWQVDAVSSSALRLLLCGMAVFDAGWVVLLFATELDGDFVSWSALLLTLNALPTLALLTRASTAGRSESTVVADSASSVGLHPAHGSSRPTAGVQGAPQRADSSSALSGVGLYALSLCVLALWGWWLWRLSFGYLAAGSCVLLLLMDTVVALLSLAHRRGGYEQQPAPTICLVVVCRLGLLVGGAAHFLVGHSVAFAALTLYTWQLLLDHLAPARTLRLLRPFAPSASTAAAPAKRGDDHVDGVLSSCHTAATSSLLGATDADARVGASHGCVPSAAPFPWPALPPLSSSFTQLPLLLLSLWLILLLFAADCGLTVFLVLTQQLDVDGAGTPHVADGVSVAESVQQLLVEHPSLLFAAVLSFVVLQCCGLSLSWRLYSNAGRRLSAGCVCCVLLCYAAVAAVAGLLCWMDGGLGAGRRWSVAVVLLVFVPALCLLALHTACTWALIDFRFTVDPAYTRQLQAEALQEEGPGRRAQQRQLRAVRRFDAHLLSLFASLLLLGGGFSWALCWVWSLSMGVVMALSLLVLQLTALPVCCWLQSSTWRWWMSVHAALGCACLLAECVFVFAEVRGGAVDGVAFLLLCLVFLYPAAVALLLGLLKWADDGWQLSPFSLWSVLAALYVLVLFAFLCSLLYPPWYIGAGSLLLVLTALLAVVRLAPHLAGSAKGQRAGNAITAVQGARRMWWTAAALLGCALPVMLGVAFDDGWLAVTALAALLVLTLSAFAARVGSAFLTAAAPLPSSASARLSALCRPPSSYSVACSQEWMGVYVLSASSGQHSRLQPPLSLRPALLALHAVALTLFVWAHLAAFFPFSSQQPTLSVLHAAAQGQSSVSLPALACAVLLSSAVALQRTRRAQAAEAAFHANVEALQSRARTATTTAEDAEDASATAEEAEGREAEEAVAPRGNGAADAVAAVACGDASVSSSLLCGSPPSAELLRLLSQARARAAQQVQLVRPFHIAQRSSPRAGAGRVAVNSASSFSSTSLFIRRAPTASTPSVAEEDELLAHQQAVDALLLHHSSSLSSSSSSFPLSSSSRWRWLCGLRAVPSFVCSSDAFAARALLAADVQWRASVLLFRLAVRLQLHHLLLVQQHAQLQQRMTMVRQFEQQRRVAQALRHGLSASAELSLRYLALLSLHAELRLQPAWEAFERCLPQWRAFRAALRRRSLAVKAARAEAAAVRADAGAERCRRVEAQQLEAVSQRVLERRKQLQAALSGEEDERVERRRQLQLQLAALDQQHRRRRSAERAAKRERRRRQPSGKEEEKRKEAEVELPGGAEWPPTSPPLSSELCEAARAQRIAAKRRQQREWQLKQRLVSGFVTSSSQPSPLLLPVDPSYAVAVRGGPRGHAAALAPARIPAASASTQPRAARAATPAAHRTACASDAERTEVQEGAMSAGEAYVSARPPTLRRRAAAKTGAAVADTAAVSRTTRRAATPTAVSSQHL